MRLELASVLLCSLAFVVAEDTSRCPEGFIKHGGSCYWFSRIKGTFAEARSYCQFLGSHLARITSKHEDKFLRSHATGTGKSYWLGAMDLGREGAFVWEGGFPLNYTNWGPGEPNNLRAEDKPEPCLILFRYYRHEWNNGDCGLAENFICERRVSGCCCSK
ncbi:perlucin-like [Haliotis cracherodii]|uniref:perlucin-like n=1 Tax=Haliotis cracherodii TaxID=6455 RepID=UPI0039E77CF7